MLSKIKEMFRQPNTLTLVRISAIPVIVILMLFPNRICAFLGALIFSIAAITDYFDGYYARRFGLVSKLGKIMDPLADKLLISSSLIMLVSHGWVPAWMACIIIGREIAITGLRTVIADSGEDMSASWLGKYKTGFQIAAIIPLLIHFEYVTVNFSEIGHVMLWGALVFTIWSGVDYFVKFKKHLQF
jgi:CDP-diacylglycerol--glycerol-3-phosphate 3-phosphatidyltransferase